jgi:competence protein ComEC
VTVAPLTVAPLTVAPSAGAAGGHLDVRLVLGAASGWLAVLVCIGRSPGQTLCVALVAAGCGLLALAAASRGIAGCAAVALMLFCIALVLIPFAGRLAHSRASPLIRLANARTAVTAELTVTGDPRVLAAAGVAGAPRAAIEASADAVSVAGQRISAGGTVLVLGPAQLWDGVLPGQRVRVDGVLQPPLQDAPLTVAVFAQSGPVLIGRPPWWQRAAGTVRVSLRRASAGLPAGVAGLLPGLVDGDTTGLDPVLAERFRLAGMTHLVAVSGTNCSILVGSVLLTLRRLRVRPGLCAVAGAVVLVGFVILARPSPSVLRAALMASVALVALGSGRARQALPTLAAAALALLVWQPLLATDPGFAMSVLATAALLVIAPGWADALRRRHVPTVLAGPIAVAAAAHVVSAPVIAAISGRVSLVAIPANVLAEPVVAPATILGFLAALLAPIWFAAGCGAAELAGWPCRWLVGVADYFGGLHGATVPWPGGMTGGLALLVLTAVLAFAARRVGVRHALAASLLVAVIVQIPVRSVASGWPPTGWLFAACDVGQGDGLVLRAGPHSAVAVDTGPDPVAIDRCLRDLDITDVALLVLSHYHLDHVGGIDGVFHNRRVERVIAGPLDEPRSGLTLVQHALDAHHLQVQTPPAGTSVVIGDVRLDVLGPPEPFHGTRSDPNNSSLVLRATVDGVRILLPGDAEVEAQQALVAAGTDLRADVLKVPHHGSAYSYPPFLAASHARIAIISVGLHNDYGHPSAILLAELARLGVPVRRTDRDGDLAITSGVGGLASVSRGTRSSVVGLGQRSGGRSPKPAVSAHSARMVTCLHAWSASTTCLTGSHPPSCSSVTRSCWSVERSARSPPPPADATRT